MEEDVYGNSYLSWNISSPESPVQWISVIFLSADTSLFSWEMDPPLWGGITPPRVLNSKTK
jgi:hypothetical protein